MAVANTSESGRSISQRESVRQNILNELRGKSKEWGIEPDVFDKIKDWGNLGLIKSTIKTTGFFLDINRPQKKTRTTLRYYFDRRMAWIGQHGGDEFAPHELQNVKTIKLKEESEGREEKLCIVGEYKGEPWIFEITREGSLLQSPISYKDYYEI